MCRAGLGAQRGGAVSAPPARLALALGCGQVAPPAAPAGPGTQGKGVGGIETQKVVVGITEEVEQHLGGRETVENTTERIQSTPTPTTCSIYIIHI